MSRKSVGQEGGSRRQGSRHRRMRELRILNAIAEALNSAPDVQQALERTLVLVTDLLGLPTGWIWLFDSETGQLYNATVRNLPPYLQEPVRMAGGDCWCNTIFLRGELTPKNVQLIDCTRLRRAVEANEAAATCGMRFHASIPLSFQDRPLGILNVTGPAWRELAPEELRLLSTIGYQVGTAIERARLAEESARMARAEERARLAREIHDTLAQSLTGIALQIEGAMRHLETDTAKAEEQLRRALAITRDSLEEARRSVLSLRPAPLTERPLPFALQFLGHAFTAETGVRVNTQVLGTPVLSARGEAELFRIAQEALANVRRHAHATEVRITLHGGPRAVRLSIRDNGRGFDAKAVTPDHYGIVGMRERANLLGGRLRVESRSGRGTTVMAVVPAAAEEG
jgi:two-component system NarL family sensor kinase